MKKVLMTCLVVLLGMSVGWVTLTWAGDGTRTDCPGRIECPLTGSKVCADQCPIQTK